MRAAALAFLLALPAAAAPDDAALQAADAAVQSLADKLAAQADPLAEGPAKTALWNAHQEAERLVGAFGRTPEGDAKALADEFALFSRMRTADQHLAAFERDAPSREGLDAAEETQRWLDATMTRGAALPIVKERRAAFAKTMVRIGERVGRLRRRGDGTAPAGGGPDAGTRTATAPDPRLPGGTPAAPVDGGRMFDGAARRGGRAAEPAPAALRPDAPRGQRVLAQGGSEGGPGKAEVVRELERLIPRARDERMNEDEVDALIPLVAGLRARWKDDPEVVQRLDRLDEQLSRRLTDRLAVAPGEPPLVDALRLTALAALGQVFPSTARVADRALAEVTTDRNMDQAVEAGRPALRRLPPERQAALVAKLEEAQAETNPAARRVKVSRALSEMSRELAEVPALKEFTAALRRFGEIETGRQARFDALAARAASRGGGERLRRIADAAAAGSADALSADDKALLAEIVGIGAAARAEAAEAETELRRLADTAPDYAAFLDALASADQARLAYIRSGEAPRGFRMDTAGPGGVPAEAAAAGLSFGPDEVPGPVRDYVRRFNRGSSGPEAPEMKGWELVSGGRREFHTSDGRLVVLIEADGSRRFLLDGKFAGASDAETISSAVHGRPHLFTLEKRGERRERGVPPRDGFISLEGVRALSGAERREALIARGREAAFLLTPRLEGGSGEASDGYAESIATMLQRELGGDYSSARLTLGRDDKEHPTLTLVIDRPGGQRVLALRLHAGRTEKNATYANPGLSGVLYDGPPGQLRERAFVHYEGRELLETMQAYRTVEGITTDVSGYEDALTGYKLGDDGVFTRTLERRQRFIPEEERRTLAGMAIDAGSHGIGTVFEQAGTSIVGVVGVGVSYGPIGWVAGERFRDSVRNDSVSLLLNSPLGRATGGREAGVTYYRSLDPAARKVYEDRAAVAGRPGRGLDEFLNAKEAGDRNAELAQKYLDSAKRTGSLVDRALGIGFTGLAGGYDVSKGFLGSLALGGAAKGIESIAPNLSRLLTGGLEVYDRIDTVTSLADLPQILREANLNDAQSLRRAMVALSDLEGLSDIHGDVRSAMADPRGGPVSGVAGGGLPVRPAPAPAAPIVPPAAPGERAAPPAETPAAETRAASPAPEARAGAPAPGQRSRLTILDRTVAHRDNVIDGVFDGRPVVVKLNAGPAEFATQNGARAAIEGVVDNVHVPGTVAGGPTKLFLDKALAAAPDDGGVFGKIAGDVLGYFREQQTVISERLPDGCVSLKDVLAGKAKLDPIAPEDYDGLARAIAAANAAGIHSRDLSNHSNIQVRQAGGRTHFHVIDWAGPENGTPDAKAIQDLRAELTAKGLFAPPADGGRAAQRAGAERAPAAPPQPKTAREIRDDPSRRPPVRDIIREMLAAQFKAGVVSDSPTNRQGARSDCQARAFYNHPDAKAIREAMSYDSFLTLFEDLVARRSGHGKAIADIGTTDSEFIGVARELGYRVSDSAPVTEAADIVMAFDRSPLGVQAVIGWTGADGKPGRHAVVIEGAYGAGKNWKFVVRDPHQPQPYLYSFEDLMALGVTIQTMRRQGEFFGFSDGLTDAQIRATALGLAERARAAPARPAPAAPRPMSLPPGWTRVGAQPGPAGVVTLRGAGDQALSLLRPPPKGVGTVEARLGENGEPVWLKTYSETDDAGERNRKIAREMNGARRAAAVLRDLPGGGVSAMEIVDICRFEGPLAEAFGHPGGMTGLVTRPAPGKPLGAFLRDGGKLDPASWERLRGAIRHLARSGIRHSDLNSGNIVVAEGADGTQTFTLIDWAGFESRKDAGEAKFKAGLDLDFQDFDNLAGPGDFRRPDETRAGAASAPAWAERYANPADARRAMERERELRGRIRELATQLGLPSDPDDAGKIFLAVQNTKERTVWGKRVWGEGQYESGPQERLEGIRAGRYDAAFFAPNIDGPKARLLALVYEREALMSPTKANGGKGELGSPQQGNRSAPWRAELMREIAALFEREAAGK